MSIKISMSPYNISLYNALILLTCSQSSIKYPIILETTNSHPTISKTTNNHTINHSCSYANTQHINTHFLPSHYVFLSSILFSSPIFINLNIRVSHFIIETCFPRTTHLKDKNLFSRIVTDQGHNHEKLNSYLKFFMAISVILTHPSI